MARVITIRGTSGSGKSTLVKRILALYHSKEPVYVEGRKRPLYILCRSQSSLPSLAVLGHYDIACGGCDTIPEQAKIHELTVELTRLGFTVLYEGLLVSAEIKRTMALRNDHGLDLQVLRLETPIEDCVAGINARRQAKKADAEEVNPRNTILKDKSITTSCKRMEEAGIPVHYCTRETSFDKALELLKEVAE